MSNEETFLAALSTFADVARSTELDGSLLHEIEASAAAIRDFRVLVPVVGSFNAGKTSLINAYLGRSDGRALPTDIVPQTALATEIHPTEDGEREGVDLFDASGRLVDRLDFAAFRRFERDAVSEPRGDAQYARARLRTEVLASHMRRMLVDMPGLDSGLKNHNAAIQRYLPLGSYFMLVVDIEHGALRQSEILQLREFLDQEVEFTVLVNKVDKKQVDRDVVVGHIAEQVRVAFGKQVPVQAVSAREGDIAAFVDAFESIDPDGALRNYWRGRLLGLFDRAITSLHTRYSAINVSSAEAEGFINELDRRREELEEKLAEDEREIRGRYSERATEGIVREVRNEVRGHADALASSYEGGGDAAFQQNLNELVRSTLNRTLNSARSETQKEIIERYRADIEGLDAQLGRLIYGGAAPGADVTGADLGRAFVDAAARSSRAFSTAADQLGPGSLKSAYTLVGGVLAATTSIVAPWVEVVLLVLPWVVGLIREAQRQQREQERRQQLRAHIGNIVAPKIASELRSVIADDYARLAGELLSGLRSSVREQIERIQVDIQKSRADIENDRQRAKARQEQFADAVRTLSEARGRIENA